MTETISRMYATPQTATDAADALKAAGFREQNVAVVTYAGGHQRDSNLPDTGVDGITRTIMAGRVLKAHARIYAEGVARGGSLVTVHADFGRARLAIRILERFEPIESGVPDPHDPPRPRDEATPLSCALNLTVLSDRPAPFSAFWNVPVLIDRAAFISKALNLPLLANGTASLSSAIGIPTLLTGTGSLSERLGLPRLLGARSEKS